jgi:4-carboxymuconolactone decarboxylase
MKAISIIAGVVVGCALSAHAEVPRLKPLVESEMSDAQLKAYRELAAGPRGRVTAPFHALLRSPELMARTQKLGEFLRFDSSIPARLNEFAILITARHWHSQYAWNGHYNLAMKAGLDPTIAADLAQGRRPTMNDDEAIVYQFCKELHETKEVSDSAYNAVLNRFGERGVIDLVGVTGYYTLLSMVLNVDRQPVLDATAPPLPVLQ